MTTYIGPCKIVCPLTCDVPDGVTLAEVPSPRHAWGDVVRCPNGDAPKSDVECERVFLVKTPGSQK